MSGADFVRSTFSPEGEGRRGRALLSSSCAAIDVIRIRDFRGHAAKQGARLVRPFPGEFSMSLDSDVIVDRRRIRRKLTFWRVMAALIAIGAIVIVGLVAKPGGRGTLTTAGANARGK